MSQCPRCGFEAKDLSDKDIQEGAVCGQCIYELSCEELES